MNDIIYEWSFSNDKNRWKLWYIIALSIVIWTVIWWFLTKQYPMSFLIILISGVYLFIENNTEDETQIKITNLWIKINNSFYDYSKISGFCFFYDWENSITLRLLLVLKTTKQLDLKVNNWITKELKDILPNFIKEDETQELSFIDKLITYLKL